MYYLILKMDIYTEGYLIIKPNGKSLDDIIMFSNDKKTLEHYKNTGYKLVSIAYKLNSNEKNIPMDIGEYLMKDYDKIL
jgi:hypothetical protein